MIEVNFGGNPLPITCVGQFRTYVDNGFHEIWSVQKMIPLQDEQVIQACKQTFVGKNIPDSETYHDQIKQGKPHYEDICYYKDGFYKFKNINEAIAEFEYVTPDLLPEAFQSNENRHQT